jgi:cell wall-associated NlpC family hydrolase
MASRLSRRKVVWLLLALPVALAACASGPAPSGSQTESEHGRNAAERAAEQAAKLVGKPYRYGGAAPSTGFDCSGLVQFSYRQAGVAVPRSTEDQRRASSRIRMPDLRPGDLLFFDQEGKKNSHVAVYLGEGRFVHAPSRGKQVGTDRLDSPYWKQHLSEARRL